MKKILIMSLFLMAVMLSNCGNSTNKGTSESGVQQTGSGSAEISFTEYEHDFGKVSEGEKLAYDFTFVNKGTTDLVVASVTTTCGCTVPKYSRKPVSPGDAGKLEVIFDTSGRSGRQTKTVTVKSNASMAVVLLKITAEVVTDNN
jgi:hypothetical protein